MYLDDGEISGDKDSILEVFTSKMEVQSVDIINAYQYAPIIESIKYLKCLDICGESRPSYDDDEDKSQGVMSVLSSWTRQGYNQPWKLLCTKTCGLQTREQRVMLQTAKLETSTGQQL